MNWYSILTHFLCIYFTGAISTFVTFTVMSNKKEGKYLYLGTFVFWFLVVAKGIDLLLTEGEKGNGKT